MKKNYKHSLLILELKELQEKFNSIERRIKLVKKRVKISYMFNDIVEHKRANSLLFELRVKRNEVALWICRYKDKIKNCQRKGRFYGMARSKS